MTMNLIFLCVAGFFAAFVDSIAGGGGIISVPAFLLAGVPPHITLGTNKFSSTCASFTSSLKFMQSGKVDLKILKFLLPFTVIGAVLGVNTVLIIDAKYLNMIVLTLLLFVGIYSLFSKSIGKEDKFKGLCKKSLILGILLAFSLGFYDGFFGPGTGSFLIFGLIGIYQFDFVRSAGNGKVMNFGSNIASLIMFAFRGQINYKLGVPVAIFMIIGAKFGTKVALKNGAKIIKPLFVTMSLCVALKILYGAVK
ncbi:membrane protein [Clostridium carboxidivorans P7]|uniref:sulfite exporter TauE/SafE family protein n=1 Tax=Clostridium carboxidivorans TaxID=217159 RepID=UPI0005562350|nr:TSUP family transporter [Clostridium carboxidivorans]AKN33712.1 membrane protein [Clostridium carboxidivorans P7]